MFESITLYDNHAVTATWQETPDHKYKVILTVKSRKQKANGEGVETEVQLHRLRSLGCDQGQGYLWSEPLPADDLAALLRTRSRTRSCPGCATDHPRPRRSPRRACFSATATGGTAEL